MPSSLVLSVFLPSRHGSIPVPKHLTKAPNLHLPDTTSADSHFDGIFFIAPCPSGSTFQRLFPFPCPLPPAAGADGSAAAAPAPVAGSAAAVAPFLLMPLAAAGGGGGGGTAGTGAPDAATSAAAAAAPSSPLNRFLTHALRASILGQLVSSPISSALPVYTLRGKL